MLLELSRIMSMFGLTPLVINGGVNELLHALLPETSPGRKASGKKEKRIKIRVARLMDCSSNFE